MLLNRIASKYGLLPFRQVVGISLLLISFPVAGQTGYPLVYKSPIDGGEMRLLRGGTFAVGGNKADTRRLITGKLRLPYAAIFDGDLNLRKLDFPDFYIDKYEVTNQRYALYVAKGGGEPSRFMNFPQFNAPQQPVTGIKWQDADGFCKWARKRLPTEMEWERAARGSAASIWPWGNEPDVARFNGKHQARYASAVVGSFPKGDTPEGVSDLAGNVWELTSSERADGLHTMKGGSFLNALSYVRGSLRWATYNERKGAEFLGFRCVLDARKAS